MFLSSKRICCSDSVSSSRVDHGGEQWLKPSLRKCKCGFSLTPERKSANIQLVRRYSCDLKLDINTANRNLVLSEDNREVTRLIEDQPYPDHPERFDFWYQILCRDGLTGRCYWEVEWKGRVYVAATYRGINRRGNSDDCGLGRNDKSWSLICHDGGFTAYIQTAVPPPTSNRVAVYLDWPAGSLSFYSVSSDTLIHLHTFNTTFTEPLYPGFELWEYESSVCLCEFEG
uniref:B30.2/SPRY domain-containing protein n=1 Tax=Myripristis murdjan TaxID=586833 RepID=A0A667ZQ41_9TELE